jgi:hypothetical protein
MCQRNVFIVTSKLKINIFTYKLVSDAISTTSAATRLVAGK